MTAGFQAFNDGGVYQIDGTTYNLARRQVISVSTSAGNLDMGKNNAGTMNYNTASIANVSFSAVTPLLVIYSPGRPAAIMKCLNTGTNTWQAQIWTYAGNDTLELHVFDRADAAAPAGAGYGLQVFDASGVLVADARQRLARVMDVQSGNITGAGAGWGQYTSVDSQTQSYSYSGIAKVGVGAMLTPYTCAPNVYYRTQGYQTNGGTISRQWRVTSIGGTYPGNENCFGSQYDWRFMAVDLSYM
jgi:hypothetical protein